MHRILSLFLSACETCFKYIKQGSQMYEHEANSSAKPEFDAG